MARYIGPKIKLSRRFGTKLGLRTNEEAVTRRPYKPGQHGPNTRRRKQSEYSVQLMEKQKARIIYGVLEKQFRRYVDKASKAQNAGLALMQLLETRLDTVVYRAGFALTQQQARQFVTHGHVTVNGVRQSIPSFQVKTGMTISLAPELIGLVAGQRGTEAVVPSWITVGKKGAEVIATPAREEITPLITEQLIIEYYSR
jgi:small subunit ribosomal protein S4